MPKTAAGAEETGQADTLAAEVSGSLYVVIPALNEGAAIGDVVRGLAVHCTHLVVVDDGSTDDTSSCALEVGATVLRHAINRGQGAALQTGIEYSLRQGARYVVTFDADGQHPAHALPALMAPIVAGEAEVVLASRFMRDAGSVPRMRRVVLRAAVLFTRLTSGARVSDTHNGLRAFSRKAARVLDIQLDRMAHASEIIDQIHRSGLVYTEVPVRVQYTKYSRAKGQSSSAALRIALDYLLGKLLR